MKSAVNRLLLLACAPFAVLAGCAGETTSEPTPTPVEESSPTPHPIDESEALVIDGGSVSGRWDGPVQVNNAIQIDPGQTLEVTANAVVLFDLDATFSVAGTLTIQGTAEEPVWFGPQKSNWPGLTVTGSLTASHLDLMYTSTGVDAKEGSQITLDNTRVIDSDASFKLANGASFDHVTVEGGNTVRVTGGILSMVDSVIDLQVPVTGADCINVSGGGLELAYSHLTGCHCTTHIVYAPLGVSISSSLLDGNSYPMMVAGAVVNLSHNNLLAGQYNIQDIGGGIEASVAGNYWGGGEPHIDSSNLGQFSGLDDYSTTAFEDVGPR